MNANLEIPLIANNISFTPYYFYNSFLKEVVEYYKKSPDNRNLSYRLIAESGLDPMLVKYYIDPISLPLLLSLSQLLNTIQKGAIKIKLSNTPLTNPIIKFLYFADFFHLVGRNQNPTFPLGKNILEFDDSYIGGFSGQKSRTEHKIRSYSLNDDLFLKSNVESIKNDEEKRDYLVEHYTFKVKEHFGLLLFETADDHLADSYVMILAELITNGVIHSGADTFALMFSDRYKTKFSISDNGIGLAESLKVKKDLNFYKMSDLTNKLIKLELFPETSLKRSLFPIFETLFYSMLKNRQGLFDLMCNVVIDSKGYFRLHNDYCQIIISSRMINELQPLYELRERITELHNKHIYNDIGESEFNDEIKLLTEESQGKFIELFKSILKKFSEDTRFSAIRFFEVKFRGVHIEVEIPN